MTEPPEHAPAPTRPGGARSAAATALAALVPMFQGALIAVGLWIDLSIHGPPASILTAIARLGVIGLTAWVLGRLLHVGAAVLDLYAIQAEAAPRLAAVSERLAAALERMPMPMPPSPAVSPPVAEVSTPASVPFDHRTAALTELRTAIERSHWTQAEALVQSFADAYPDDMAAGRLSDELTEAKSAALADFRDRLDAARTANDPERVFEIREALVPLLGHDERRTLDRDLARWFMGQVQKRLRNGVLSLEVVMLVTRAAEIFDATPEGASLRAALPTLRRSVGICARCGKPYTGIADACPACLTTASFPVYTPPSPSPPENHGITQPSELTTLEENPSEPE